MKRFKLNEVKQIIEPSTRPNTMSLWHGGNLDDAYDESKAQKKGRWEFGVGLYLTTHYSTAQKYSKGSRKMYFITIKKGVDAKDAKIGFDKILEFIDDYVIRSKRKEVLNSMARFKEALEVPAYIFINNIVNHDAIPSSRSNALRNFLVSQGIDYVTVPNAFGWHEMMIVLFNMNLIVEKKIVAPKDQISIYDLPTEFA